MADAVSLTFPDGSVKKFDAGTSGRDVAESISKSLAKKAVAIALMDGGASPDVLNGQGKSPLMLATLARKFPIAMEMLSRSKDPTLKDKNGLNLIQLAFFNESARNFQLGLNDQIQQFIEAAMAKGVDPNEPIEGMGTLKQISEQAGAIDLARYLSGLSAS